LALASLFIASGQAHPGFDEGKYTNSGTKPYVVIKHNHDVAGIKPQDFADFDS
jgi:hypothetical protein